jgi:hypothetical protein
MLLTESADGEGQQRGADRRKGTHSQPPRAHSGDVVQRVLEGRELTVDLLRVPHHGLARVGEDDAATVSLEQRLPGLHLQLLDLLGNRRHREADGLRCLRHRAVARHAGEQENTLGAGSADHGLKRS